MISDLCRIWPIALSSVLIQISEKLDMSTIFETANKFNIFILLLFFLIQHLFLFECIIKKLILKCIIYTVVIF